MLIEPSHVKSEKNMVKFEVIILKFTINQSVI